MIRLITVLTFLISISAFAGEVEKFESTGRELTSYNCTVHFDSNKKFKEKVEEDRISLKRYYIVNALSASEAIVAAESRGQSFLDYIQHTNSIALSKHASELKSVMNGNIKRSHCMETGVWE